MTAKLFTLPKQTPFTNAGALIPGAKAYFYLYGTSTPQDTYTTAALTTPNANPVVADSNGRFGPIYLDDTLRYKVKVTDADDVEIYTEDDFLAATSLIAGNIDSESATDGYVLTADGAGNAAWEENVGNTITASDVNAETSTDGYVLTSDGAGGAQWEVSTASGAAYTAGDMNAESSADGYVLTSDGAGGAAWEVSTAAGGLVAADNETITGNWTFEVSTVGDLIVSRDSSGASGMLFENTVGPLGYLSFNSDEDFIISDSSASTLGRYSKTGSWFLKEHATSDADVAGFGQLWVKLETPNTLWFTDDAGTDFPLAAGTGDVIKVGTPVDNQLGVWTGDGTLEGDANLSWGGTTLSVTGDISAKKLTLESTTGHTEFILQKRNVGDNDILRFNNELGVQKWNIGASANTDDDFFIGRYNDSGVWQSSAIYIYSADGTIVTSSTVNGRDMTADGAKLDAIEAAADVTDTANVTAAGALMDSEVDADIKTLSLPASTTISTFGASLIDDADAAAARTTLGIDAIPPAHGEMTISGNATATTVSVADTYYQVVAGWTTGDVEDVTFTSNELIVGTTGLYMVMCSFSFTGAVNDTFTFALADNDTAVASTAIQHKTATTDVTGLSVQGIMSLTAADAVQLYGKNNADTDNFTVTDANFSIFRIG